MALEEDQIREALKQVIDPELFVNIVDLGLIYNVTTAPSPEVALPPTDGDTIPTIGDDAATASTEAADPTVAAAAPDSAVAADLADADQAKEDIFIDMTMTSPACPAGPQLIANTKQVLGRLPNVGKVEVRIVMTPPWTPDKMTEDARDQLGIF
ncbi:MAG: metal-sulfur cluster assembly factor [Pirellulales bacterium]